jgi:hypothetical protein
VAVSSFVLRRRRCAASLRTVGLLNVLRLHHFVAKPVLSEQSESKGSG